VVFEEEIQRVVIASVAGAPEPDRIESSEARRFLAAQNPDLRLDRLEAADESEAPERMDEVEVNLVQMHARERLAKERHIEPRAVEGDEELRVFQGRRELFQVVALDERSSRRTVVHPNHSDRIPAQ